MNCESLRLSAELSDQEKVARCYLFLSLILFFFVDSFLLSNFVHKWRGKVTQPLPPPPSQDISNQVKNIWKQKHKKKISEKKRIFFLIFSLHSIVWPENARFLKTFFFLTRKICWKQLLKKLLLFISFENISWKKLRFVSSCRGCRRRDEKDGKNGLARHLLIL